MNKLAFLEAFNSREDLKQFGDDALLLFALELTFDIDDILGVASTSLTEGCNDKKADLIYIDTEFRHAVIAQTYIAASITNKKGEPKKEAPANKASDLNTAISWVIASPIEKIPEEIKPQTIELREAINNGTINRIYLWYVHNLPESLNVKRKLDTVENSAKTLVASIFPEHKDIEIRALEVGIFTLEEWYKSISTPILISDKFRIQVSGGFEVSGPDWKAYITSIPAKWLYEQIHKYKTDLFSVDVREYLGSREDDTNINYGIKKTAFENPSHFFVYNNGITALVHEFKPSKIKGHTIINFKGFSIMNGAQTTGTIGSLDSPPDDSAYVQIRFIMCRRSKRVHDIVLYNNTQNKVTGPDFRSNDNIQRRLEQEFKQIPGVEYVARRGGYEDIIKRRSNLLPSVTAGQALAALHGDPGIAYHQKTKIWDENELYVKYFNEGTTAKHIVFSYSLLKAIEKRKFDLLNKSRCGNLTNQDETEFSFFHNRGSILLMVCAIAECLEIFLNQQISNKFALNFNGNISPEKATRNWIPIVEATSSFSNYLSEGLSDGFRTRQLVDKAIQSFRSLVNSTKKANANIYNTFAGQVDLS
jgi:hypothetical protein